MPLVAAIANSQGLTANGPLTLLLNSTSILNRVPIETVELTETAGGTGGSSPTLVFDIEDPLGTLTPPATGDRVTLIDNVRSEVLFTGWISRPKRVQFGPKVTYQITALGMDKLLDWAVIGTTTTIPGATGGAMLWTQAIQMLLAAVRWPYDGIRWTADGTTAGSDAAPIGDLDVVTNTDVVLPAGTTVRDAIDLLLDGSIVANDLVQIITIKPNGAFRTMGLFILDITSGLGADYVGQTLTDSVGATTAYASATYDEDGAAVYRGVYVTGGSAAGSGLVMDGSGKPGRIGAINVPSSTTTATLATAAAEFLASAVLPVQGKVFAEDWTPPAGFHPPAWVRFPATSPLGTDLVNYGGSISGRFATTEIVRRFVAGGTRVDLEISYGRQPPSYVANT